MVHILHARKVNSKTNILLGIFIGHKMVLVPVKNAKTNINLHRKIASFTCFQNWWCWLKIISMLLFWMIMIPRMIHMKNHPFLFWNCRPLVKSLPPTVSCTLIVYFWQVIWNFAWFCNFRRFLLSSDMCCHWGFYPSVIIVLSYGEMSSFYEIMVK